MGKEKKKRLTRAQRKAVLKQQKANEKRLLEEGKISPRVKYLPRSFLWNALAVALAFLMGAFATLGGLVGAGVFAGTKISVKDLLGENYLEYVTADYADASVFEITSDIIEDIRQTGTENISLSLLNKYTPYLKTAISKVADIAGDAGVSIDVDDMMAQPVSSLGSYVSETIVPSIVLGDVLKLTPESDPLMLGICYGAEGEDYTVVDGVIVMNEGKSAVTVGDLTEDASSLLDRIYVESVLSVTAESDASLRYIAYGTEGESYRIVTDENGNRTVEMLVNPATGEPYAKKTLKELSESDDLLGDAKIGDLVNVDAETGLLAAIKNWSVNDLKNTYRIERLKLSQIITINASSSSIMQAMKDWRIADLKDQNKIDTLVLSDVIAVDGDSPMILQSLKNTCIGDFSEAINNLRLVDILGKEDLENNKLLRNLKYSTLDTLAEDIEAISVKDVFNEEIYSYMVIENGMTYEKLVNAYSQGENPYKNIEGKSSIRPEALENPTATTKYYLKDTNTELVWGSFLERNGSYVAVQEDELYKKTESFVNEETGITESVTFYYAKTRLSVSPVYGWSAVDYDANRLVPLDDGRITTADGAQAEGYREVVTNSIGNAYTEDGEALVYTVPSEEIYYPLYTDENGVYCMTYSASGAVERMDFEKTVTGYTATDGDGETVTYGYRNGKATDGEGASYRVYTQAEENGEPAYDYIVIEKTVVQGYYEENAETIVLYGADEAEEKFYASWTDADGTSHEAEEVDRYLSGTWYLLFGGEEENEDGTLSVIDLTDTAALEISERVTQTSNQINELPLWKLYLHEFIDENPFVQLSEAYDGENNLNMLCVYQVIGLVKRLVSKS